MFGSKSRALTSLTAWNGVRMGHGMEKIALALAYESDVLGLA